MTGTRTPAAQVAAEPEPVRRTAWRHAAWAAAIGAAAGVVSDLVMPRGPVTPVHVLAGMALGFVAGGVAGRLARSRWAMLIAPLAFVVACEIGRAGLVGPTVDRPDLTTTIGVLVLVLGRGFQALVQLLPMVLGAAVGAGLARGTDAGRSRRRWPRWARRGVVGIMSLALVAFAVVLTRPGTTAPIDGRGGVAELATVQLGGHDQTVLIRGRSTDNPVLLYLAGGPGQSDLGYTRAYMAGLEDDVVFAVWDQRGTGTSYAALDPTGTWTLDQAVADTVELSRYLADRFGKEKIYLFGNSWGSTLGVLAVQRHPELFHAFIGAGQMVSQLATDRIIYRQLLDHAARTGDTELAGRMRDYGPPPYRDIYAYGFVLGYYDTLAPYPRTDYYRSHGPAGIDGTGVPEYGPLDKINKEKGLADMAAVLYPQLQQLDFRTSVRSLEVPVHLVQGAHELSARADLAREWFGRLRAPAKQWITFADSGHVPQFEEFPHFRTVLRQIVRNTS
jgi:pimeloyl-ACP methyl ester carboxylesterase